MPFLLRNIFFASLFSEIKFSEDNRNISPRMQNIISKFLKGKTAFKDWFDGLKRFKERWSKALIPEREIHKIHRFSYSKPIWCLRQTIWRLNLCRKTFMNHFSYSSFPINDQGNGRKFFDSIERKKLISSFFKKTFSDQLKYFWWNLRLISIDFHAQEFSTNPIAELLWLTNERQLNFCLAFAEVS